MSCISRGYCSVFIFAINLDHGIRIFNIFCMELYRPLGLVETTEKNLPNCSIDESKLAFNKKTLSYRLWCNEFTLHFFAPTYIGLHILKWRQMDVVGAAIYKAVKTKFETLTDQSRSYMQNNELQKRLIRRNCILGFLQM